MKVSIPSKTEIKLYSKALQTYGYDNQRMMVVEECAELMDAMMKFHRARAKNEDVITELADVSIMVEQMAVHFGLEEYIQEKKRKLERLKKRLNKKAFNPT